MSMDFFQTARTGLNFTLTIPQSIMMSALQEPVEQTPSVASSESCIDCLIALVKDFFSPLNFWISQLFPRSSDPALLAKWDQVVEKELAPIEATPASDGDFIAGKTLADAFVRAASKTKINPSFSHVLVIDRKQEEGFLFSPEGYYSHHAQNAYQFNNPHTLVVVGERLEHTIKNFWEQKSAHTICNATSRMNHATIFPLNAKETDMLENGRMPFSLLKFLRGHSVDSQS